MSSEVQMEKMKRDGVSAPRSMKSWSAKTQGHPATLDLGLGR